MNFLAHIYLSYDNSDLEIGNFIADSVKGNKYLKYPETIKQGILLHRKIDTFTDTHLKVREAKNYFSEYNHYAGVITDIIFDHFLAKNWNLFHKNTLLEFSNQFYDNLEVNWSILPLRIKNMFPIMKSQNWLYTYTTKAGISDILFQMNRRTQNISKMNYSIIELEENYSQLEALFFDFFKSLEEYSKNEIKLLTI